MMMMNRDVTDTASSLNNSEHEDIHVEIEQVPSEESDAVVDAEQLGDPSDLGGQGSSSQVFSSGGGIFSSNSNGRVQLYTRVQGKRTVILPHQRKILEEFYRTGMTSASYNLHHLHEAAADQTGLEIYVIKNWVRNRRRPAIPKRQDDSQIPNPLPSPVPLIPVTTVTITAPQQVPHPAPPLTFVEPKRLCYDGNESGYSDISLLVKVRIADSGEPDFVEVDVKELTYSCLVRSCCDEFEISIDDVAKLRKLPNVLIRKDRDVVRLKNEQELELVLKSNSSGGSLSQAYMTLNSYSNSSSVQMMNVNPLMSHDASLISMDNQHVNT